MLLRRLTSRGCLLRSRWRSSDPVPRSWEFVIRLPIGREAGRAAGALSISSAADSVSVMAEGEALAGKLDAVSIAASAQPAFENGGAGKVLRPALYSDTVLISSILGGELGGSEYVGQKVVVGGWVKTGRVQGKNTFAFLELNDGSTPLNLQVMVDAEVAEAHHRTLGQLTPTGTSVVVEGELKKPPESAKKQLVELKVEKILDVGTVDTSSYPIAKAALSFEYLRNYQHLRARTNTISAVARIRHALTKATHDFFDERQFICLQTPIITTSDCEGAGEMFQVTTLLSQAEKREQEALLHPPPTEADVEAAKKVVAEKGDAVKQLKADKKSKSEISRAVQELTSAKEEVVRLEETLRLKGGILHKEGGGVNYAADFFSTPAYLTVSGQLQAETYACALGRVYTFGPTFRAENSHTTRHLAEFWMVEPEMAFADLEDDMNCAEDYVRYLCRYLLERRLDDLKFFEEKIDPTVLQRLRMVESTPFQRLSYTDAIEVLEKVPPGRFENKVEWGIDLASEHERYLAEEVYKKPVIVYNYPKGIKAFYMRLNDDGKTVAAMDVLCPKIGELVGGSQREDRLDVLRQRVKETGVPEKQYDYYLDLRRHGSVKHAGFGLGFERMVLFVTGLDNIREAIPFPRYPGKADL